MPLSSEFVDRMYGLYSKGFTLEQVAKKHGSTRQNILKLFQRRGLAPFGQRGAPPELIVRMRADYLAGLTMKADESRDVGR